MPLRPTEQRFPTESPSSVHLRRRTPPEFQKRPIPPPLRRRTKLRNLPASADHPPSIATSRNARIPPTYPLPLNPLCRRTPPNSRKAPFPPPANQSHVPLSAAAKINPKSARTRAHPANPSRQMISPHIHNAGCVFLLRLVIKEITTPAKESTGPANMQPV